MTTTCPPTHRHGETGTCYAKHGCRCVSCAENRSKDRGRWEATATAAAAVKQKRKRELSGTILMPTNIDATTPAAIAKTRALVLSRVPDPGAAAEIVMMLGVEAVAA